MTGRQITAANDNPFPTYRQRRTGLDGKQMTYDAEIRPLTVTLAGVLAFSIEYLFTDQLGSIRDVVKGTARMSYSVYEPFGQPIDTIAQPSTIPEAHGFIGERFDPATQLQYLNARYYDPELALFLQPDWLDPTLPGVGTHRYAYAEQDPVNARDPGGNGACVGLGGKSCQNGGVAPDPTKPPKDHSNDIGGYVQTGGQMGGLNGEWRNDGTPTCLHCYNDASMFLAPATVVNSAGRVLIEIYARTARTRQLMVDALMGHGGFLRSPIGLETLRRIASGTRIARVYEMMDFDDRSDTNFRNGMSQAGTYQMFVNPDVVDDTYRGFDGERHHYLLAQAIGHEFGHGVWNIGNTLEEELDVVSRFDNPYLQSDGWMRGELRDGY